MKKMILGGHLVGQAKDFHQHHIWCFPLPCTGKTSPWMLHHPLQWSAVMSSHAAFMASNRDIWSCALWSYTFQLHSQKIQWLCCGQSTYICSQTWLVRWLIQIVLQLEVICNVTMSMSDFYGIYMHAHQFFIIEWIVLNVMAYTMKNDWEVVKSLTV